MRSGARTIVVAAILALVALGVWQLRRRAEKLSLIARVERRLAAAPVPAPGPARWAAIGADAAYTRVAVHGRYRTDTDTRVQAVTQLGGGYWLLSPFDTGQFVVLVNRGFVPAEGQGSAPPPAGETTVHGLLRLSEPAGGFLRSNEAAADRWYSRDIAAIAARRRLGRIAPYFIDADAGPASIPRGGLTTVRFANNHLIYAITWSACAGGLATLAWWAGRRR